MTARIAQIKSKKLKKEEVARIRSLLKSARWSPRQIEGQLEALNKLLTDPNGTVAFASIRGKLIGYISAQFYAWNRLGQIHGLMVHSDHRNQGIASALVKEVEAVLKKHRARGVYVDTPVDNLGGCAFYKKIGFKKAYIMPEYYDVSVDGVTFLNIF
jgi:ribosomal protein S18 acetylase RimI-like enzyme